MKKPTQTAPASPGRRPFEAGILRTGSCSALLDAREAGELLNVPHTWVLAEARADRIPYVPIGRYRRFDAAELEAWWRARARGPWRDSGAAALQAKAVTGLDPVASEREAA
jgi:excisionase family DNA binding protein